MKKALFAIGITLSIMGCSKSGDSPTPNPTPTPTPTPTEQSIAFTIDIDPGAGNIYAATGASQAIKVNVTSTLPSAGVQIDVKTTKDADNSTLFNTSLSSTSANTTTTLDSLKPGVVCTATVIVTSKSTSTNSSTKTFKIARK